MVANVSPEDSIAKALSCSESVKFNLAKSWTVLILYFLFLPEFWRLQLPLSHDSRWVGVSWACMRPRFVIYTPSQSEYTVLYLKILNKPLFSFTFLLTCPLFSVTFLLTLRCV